MQLGCSPVFYVRGAPKNGFKLDAPPVGPASKPQHHGTLPARYQEVTDARSPCE